MVSPDVPNRCHQDAEDRARFLLLHPDDNILICTQSAQAGECVDLDGMLVALGEDIALGHKIARIDLRAGDKILRYGLPIGTMTRPARQGAHIHLHNLKSDYLPAHDRVASGREGAEP